MNVTGTAIWERFQKHCSHHPEIGLALDLSRLRFHEDFFATMHGRLQAALTDMQQLEGGSIANREERRMVGHYWLRNAALAPSEDLRREIEQTIEEIKGFARAVHAGEVAGASGPFTDMILVGIGGSALGPQFVAQALGHPATDRVRLHTFDNTDPDGFDRVLAPLAGDLGRTLAIIISKSGGTKETRNGLLELESAYARAGLPFGPHAVAVTCAGSELDRYAEARQWRRRFRMWDWVGGRTSQMSAVGLLPAALQGIDIDNLLRGAAACDTLTRRETLAENPAARLALGWFHATDGRGAKDMVIIPYKDRLELFSRYLQQLVMESLGKALDRAERQVNQGIAVYGNKGSTDQHAYVQQLRDGLNNFFVTFIEVLKDRSGPSIEVEPGVTAGDYLAGFFLGTRHALSQNGRESITITIDEVTPFSVGVLVALYERAVGLYASLINVNAYHQPGVQAGKQAAEEILVFQRRILNFLSDRRGDWFTPIQVAAGIPPLEGSSLDKEETVFKLLERLAANPAKGVARKPGATRFDSAYRLP